MPDSLSRLAVLTGSPQRDALRLSLGRLLCGVSLLEAKEDDEADGGNQRDDNQRENPESKAEFRKRRDDLFLLPAFARRVSS